MPINRGPSDIDERPFVRCTDCQKLLKCYRGRLLKQVTNEHGTWEHFEWLCSGCLGARVTRALQ